MDADGDQFARFRLKPGLPAYSLTEQEAFLALDLFLSQYYARAGNDLATLMADISVETDGGTLDPAAWDDWLECVRAVKGEAAGVGDTWKALGYPTILRGQGPEGR